MQPLPFVNPGDLLYSCQALAYKMNDTISEIIKKRSESQGNQETGLTIDMRQMGLEMQSNMRSHDRMCY